MTPKQQAEIILSVMKEEGCYGQANMIVPSELFAKCKAKGIENQKEIEAVLITLIDNDIIDYEMDDNLQTSELWLLED